MKYLIEFDGTDNFAYDGLFVGWKKDGARKVVKVAEKASQAMQFTDLEKCKRVAKLLSRVGKIGFAIVRETNGTHVGKTVTSYYKGNEERD